MCYLHLYIDNPIFPGIEVLNANSSANPKKEEVAENPAR